MRVGRGRRFGGGRVLVGGGGVSAIPVALTAPDLPEALRDRLTQFAVRCEVRRMGGGFGGKESQANALACAAAVVICALRPMMKEVAEAATQAGRA